MTGAPQKKPRGYYGSYPHLLPLLAAVSESGGTLSQVLGRVLPSIPPEFIVRANARRGSRYKARAVVLRELRRFASGRPDKHTGTPAPVYIRVRTNAAGEEKFFLTALGKKRLAYPGRVMITRGKKK